MEFIFEEVEDNSIDLDDSYVPAKETRIPVTTTVGTYANLLMDGNYNFFDTVSGELTTKPVNAQGLFKNTDGTVEVLSDVYTKSLRRILTSKIPLEVVNPNQADELFEKANEYLVNGIREYVASTYSTNE